MYQIKLTYKNKRAAILNVIGFALVFVGIGMIVQSFIK
jgi:hypothetical protein